MKVKNSAALILEKNGQAIGYALLSPGKEPNQLVPPDSIQIKWLYILEEWTGRKLGDVLAARELLRLLPSAFRAPEIAPGADGGVGFEWILDIGSIRKLFIDIGPGATWSAYWRLSSGETSNVPRQEINQTTPGKVTTMFQRLGVVDASLGR